MEQTLSTLMTKHHQTKAEIEIDPWQVITIKNSKKAKETLQLHLGQRGGTKLVNFHNFHNLQILWLNKNSLTSLKGLQHNFRVKHLFLQHNKINTIDGIFEKLKHIETLIIYDNELRDLQKIIKSLKNLTSLQQVDMFDNPAAHEPNYKFRVLFAIPSLKILDRHKIIETQRMQAIAFMSQNNGRKKNKKPFV